MTLIGSINGIVGTTTAGTASTGAREAALGAIGEIGHRVLAWVGASGGAADRTAWSTSTGTASDFRPNPRELARGGDVYGLGDIGDGIAERLGGTPAEDGELRRALKNFTREVVVQFAGLSGDSADRQFAGVREALDAAGGGDDGGGLAGVSQRLEAATAVLARGNGN